MRKLMSARLPLLPVPLVVLTLAACLPDLPDEKQTPPPEGSAAGQCVDGADNDEDGIYDCADPDCAAAPDCSVAPAPPEGLAVAIAPATPEDGDELSCVIATEAVDPNGDTVTYTYAWAVDGVDAERDTDTVPEAFTSVAQTWTCTVTPSDGTLTGVPASASVTIQQGNRAPSAPAVAITPAEPTDDDALSCAVVTESVDPDGDAVTYAYAWTVDGTDAAVTVASVDADRTSVGETWTCSVTAGDGSATSEVGSASVGIAAAPTCGDGSVTLTASGVDFVTVCAQTFEMGCTPGMAPCNSDETLHTVTLTHDYYVGRTEVTQGQFGAVMGYNPSYFSSCGDDCPVEQVDWNEAAAYANVVSAAAGLDACYTCTGTGTSVTCEAFGNPYTCEGYRLLTEAEWEAAARCGDDMAYAGTRDVDIVAWYSGNSGGISHRVAEKMANACGLFDMSGNVRELTADWYRIGYHESASGSDPVEERDATHRVIRGGDWYWSAADSRVATRNRSLQSDRTSFSGLRLARTAR